MGRLKKSRRNLIDRNKLNIAKHNHKRLSDGSNSVVTGCRPRPSLTSLKSSIIQSSTHSSKSKSSDENEGSPPKKKESLTVFALYDSYKEKIDASDTANSYILVDKNLLISFICKFPCSECFITYLEIVDIVEKGYAHSLKICCSECLSVVTFQTSQQTGHSDANSSRAPYDVNRRLVQAFTSVGKGHRKMEAFSMHMNMKSLAWRAYERHIDQLHSSYSGAANDTLKTARGEVRKAYTELESLPLDYAGSLDISVSYDGSW